MRVYRLRCDYAQRAASARCGAFIASSYTPSARVIAIRSRAKTSSEPPTDRALAAICWSGCIDDSRLYRPPMSQTSLSPGPSPNSRPTPTASSGQTTLRGAGCRQDYGSPASQSLSVVVPSSARRARWTVPLSDVRMSPDRACGADRGAIAAQMTQHDGDVAAEAHALDQPNADSSQLPVQCIARHG